MSDTDSAGRRYVPAPLRVNIEQEDAPDVRDVLADQAWVWAQMIEQEPDGRVALEASLGYAQTATSLLRTALAVEDARLDAESRKGKGRRRS